MQVSESRLWFLRAAELSGVVSDTEFVRSGRRLYLRNGRDEDGVGIYVGTSHAFANFDPLPPLQANSLSRKGCEAPQERYLYKRQLCCFASLGPTCMLCPSHTLSRAIMSDQQYLCSQVLKQNCKHCMHLAHVSPSA